MNEITREHILSAIKEIDEKGIRNGRHSSTYDLIHEDKPYPPKLVISIANRYATGEELDSNEFHGGPNKPAFDLLLKEGFEIVPKKDPIASLIENYKKHIEFTQLKDEVYKWKLINDFKGRPNTDATDFYQEIKSIKFNNLVYAMGIAVLHHLTQTKTEELRNLFRSLFDKNKDLSERILFFKNETLKIYRSLGETLPHHQDERSIATYLTYHNSNEYTLYKASFYKKYCKLIGIKEAAQNEKYVHYIKLINDLIEKYIKPDKELISKVKSLIPQYYDGNNHMLLAQDILYQMLDKSEKKQYWLYAPGENAHKWDEFYEKGIVAIGWDDLGDLKNYKSRSEIKNALVEAYGGKGDKKNDVAANDDFANKINIGDIIIVKRGRSELLGYGEVTSEYYFEENDGNYKSRRNIDWKLKGNWNLDHSLVLKTLTDITGYPSENPKYIKYYEALLAIMEGNKKKEINVKAKFIDWLVENSSGGNYFINQFNSSEEKLKKEIDNYEAIYKQNFNLELFIIDVKNYKTEIEIIKNNIYRKETEFYEYGSTHASGRPKAILGNKNYLQFLNEYFTNQNIMENGTNNNQFPLNQILYGPPGTGKTFNSINKALEIINEEEEKELNWEDRSAVKNLFDKRIDEGRVVFTTFHQSMSYEDFIEGIKPEEPEKEGDPVIYKIKYGILRDQCIEASFEIAQLREDDVTEEVLDFSFRYDKFVADTEEKLIAGEVVKLKIKKGAAVLVDSISQNGNVLIKHVEGNRVYTVSKNRLTKLNSVIKDLDKINNISNEFKEIIGGSNSSAYWSVLNAIREEKFNLPITTEKRQYTFEEKKEVVLSLSKSDFKNKKGKPFVLIIDEINRGNVSQIFGELITLIEEDKRLGKEEALEVTLPYSKEKFGVPANLYIIGTMNTADRSVEALDAALRRRFCFEEMPPLYHLDGLQNDIFGYKAFEILRTINSRIEKLIEKDHTIGHSYLLNKDENSIVDSFYKNIIPLLQEYFFGDYSKLGLVLGKGFVHLKESDEGSNIFADFDDASNDFESRNVYEIIDYRKVADYKLLLNKVEVIMDFEKAIQVLMNKKVV